MALPMRKFSKHFGKSIPDVLRSNTRITRHLCYCRLLYVKNVDIYTRDGFMKYTGHTARAKQFPVEPLLTYRQYSSEHQVELTDEDDVLYKQITLEVKCHDVQVLTSYTKFACIAAEELGIKIKDLTSSVSPFRKKNTPRLKASPNTPSQSDKDVTKNKKSGSDITESTENQVSGENVTDKQVAGENVTEIKVSGENVTENQVSGENVTEKQVSGENVTEKQVAGENVTENQVSGENVTEIKVSGENVTENQDVAAASEKSPEQKAFEKLITMDIGETRKEFERQTLLASTHIYKKHQVAYEARTHYKTLDLIHLTGSTADTYLEYIQRNLPEGVAMKVTKRRIEMFPAHMKPPEHSQKQATR